MSGVTPNLLLTDTAVWAGSPASCLNEGFVLKRTPFRKLVVTALGLLPLAVLLVVLFGGDKTLEVRMLYATQGDAFDPAAYGQLRQSLLAGLVLEKQDLARLSARKLHDYDTIYLDPSLHRSLTDAQRQSLEAYVRGGGHLFLENAFAADFEPAFLGAARLVDVPAPDREALPTAAGATLWTYPASMPICSAFSRCCARSPIRSSVMIRTAA